MVVSASHTREQQPLQLSQKQKSLVVYGFGSAGKAIVDSLLDVGLHIDWIIDKNKFGTRYRDIPIVSLAEMDKINNQNRDCLITLHNHYIDIRAVYNELLAYHFCGVYLLSQLKNFSNEIRVTNGYWLDLDFNYAGHEVEINTLKALLADKKSIELVDQIVSYRTSGDINDYPEPSLFDEYSPKDLPRYKGPIKLIDCGAFTGVAIEKLMHAGYAIDSFVAFEPDLVNYEKLSGKAFNVRHSTCLPLGVWSCNTQLRFNSNASMGSSIDSDGDTIIQCVRVDDVLKNYEPNLIKFDVEGAEVEAINGLEKTIKRYKPNLAISVYHKPKHFFEIPLLINSWGLGYQFHLRVHEHNTFGVVVYCLQKDLIAA